MNETTPQTVDSPHLSVPAPNQKTFQKFDVSEVQGAIAFDPKATTFTSKNIVKLLNDLAVGHNRSHALGIIGATHYGLMQWLRAHPEARELVEQAEDAGRKLVADRLEEKAQELALKGAKKPITWHGEVTDYYTEEQPDMVRFLLERTHDAYAPKRETGAQVQVNIGLGDRLEQAIRKSQRARHDGTIDADVSGDTQ